MKSAPSNLSNCKVFKELLSYLKSAPRNLSNGKIFQKKWKYLNFGLKSLYLGLFGLHFSKKLVLFEISTLKFFNLPDFMRKQWCLKLWLKMLYLGIVGAIIFKKYCPIWNQHPGICRFLKFSKNFCHIWSQHTEICQFGKFCEKTMMSKFVTKNALLGHFLGFCFLKILSYLKSTSWNFPIYQIWLKNIHV